jgi:hypothetical protein
MQLNSVLSFKNKLKDWKQRTEISVSKLKMRKEDVKIKNIDGKS